MPRSRPSNRSPNNVAAIGGHEGFLRPVCFLSDRSIDYILVRNIERHAGSERTAIVPIYFWSTREGRSAQDSAIGDRLVRLTVIFAPCVIDVHREDRHVQGFLDPRIADFVLAAATYRIPTVIGAPHVTEIFGAANDPECSWWIPHVATDDAGKNSSGETPDGYAAVILDELREHGLFATLKRAPARPWSETISLIRQLRSRLSGEGHSFFHHGRRPFFVLLFA